jgi:hypothetical protein
MAHPEAPHAEEARSAVSKHAPSRSSNTSDRIMLAGPARQVGGIMMPAGRDVIVKALAVGLFAAASWTVLWLGALQPRGMMVGALAIWISYTQRLWPIAAVGALSLLLAAFFAARRPAPESRLVAAAPAWPAILIGGAFVLSLAVVADLRAFPNSGDEYSYIFAAQTFLSGRLWNPLPPLPDFFSIRQIFELDGKWVSQHPASARRGAATRTAVLAGLPARRRRPAGGAVPALGRPH